MKIKPVGKRLESIIKSSVFAGELINFNVKIRTLNKIYCNNYWICFQILLSLSCIISEDILTAYINPDGIIYKKL